MYRKQDIYNIATAPINSRIEPITALNKGETIQQVYNRLEPKPDILLNGNMYDTEKKVFVQGYRIGDNVLCKANYGGHLFIADKGKYRIEQHPNINIECDWAMEGTGIVHPYNVRNIASGFITGKHARTTIGFDKEVLKVISTTTPITFQDLEKICLEESLDYLINLDGGGSVGLIADGIVLINSTRPNMNYIAIYYPKGFRKPLIALDDGHGMETAGKRTPKYLDGTFMHENEFNNAVLQYLKKDLLLSGFDVLEVAPTDKDTPLETRTNLANNKKADLYLSIHANAYGDGLEWNNVRGIETYAHKSYPETVKIAEIIHKWIIKGTQLPNRGVKDGSHLWVCRKTNMSAVLVELGFMTNKEDAKLLLSDNYRRECASELAQALCEIYNIKYISAPTEENIPQIKSIAKVTYQGKSITAYLNDENRTIAEVRQLAELLGHTVDWDSKTQTVIIR